MIFLSMVKINKIHDERLSLVVDKLKQANITLSVKKCEISQNKVKFAGHVVFASGLHAAKDII